MTSAMRCLRATAVVILVGLTHTSSAASGARPQSTTANVRAAIVRALPPIQRSAAEFAARRACVSCHHNILPVLLLHLAEDQGFPIDRTVVGRVETRTFRTLRVAAALDDAVQGTSVDDPTPNDSYLLMAAHAARVAPDLTLAVHARRILSWQRADGHWITSDFRPPHSSSVFTATATAVRALQLYLPEEMQDEGRRSIQQARVWLTENQPISTEDAAFRLLGLVWGNAPATDIAPAIDDLLHRQQTGGGWPQLAGYASDAYSTGEALFALRQAGVEASAPAVVRGLRFLVVTQASDGTWHVRTRMLSPATVSPPYFTTGFPYQKDEFLSYAGSCWAVMGLLSSTDESETGARPRADGATQRTATTRDGTAPGDQLNRAAPWIRAALFGPSAQLAELLDGGLSPNAQTSGGTTILMMAAHDPGKVRLLLARGAEPARRAPSGVDAATIAASYGGTSAALRLLLDAGADPQPPSDLRVMRSPLLFASMVGDVESVRLLLSRGADPAGRNADTPLASAVTFGHADVVHALIAAGAPVHGTESSGINLLHWATIANRATIVPELVAAGVPLEAVDDSGYTPLMYAATIDFGDDATLHALLAAGADPGVRNDAGRTPRQQAHRLGLKRLEAALR